MADRYNRETVAPGDLASKLAAYICRNSFGNSPAVQILTGDHPGLVDMVGGEKNFRGMTGFMWKPWILRAMTTGAGVLAVPGGRSWEMIETMQNDGAGGKLAFHALEGSEAAFEGAAWEIMAMCLDDIARFGGLPVVLSNEIQAQRITEENFRLFEAVMRGFSRALEQTRTVSITGETAIMRPSITAFCDLKSDQQLIMTWGASCTGLLHSQAFINGSTIRAGMPIVGFWEPGYRCNGGTFFVNLLLALAARRMSRPRHWFHQLLTQGRGDIHWLLEQNDLMDLVRQLTIPSLCYTPTLIRVMGWKPDGTVGDPLAKIHGVAHITGGGVWHKLGDLLPDGIGAELDQMFKPAEVLRMAWEMSLDIPGLELKDEQPYGTFHGACGALAVVEPGEQMSLIKEAEADGIKAKVVGMTMHSPEKKIIIHSRFQEGRLLQKSMAA